MADRKSKRILFLFTSLVIILLVGLVVVFFKLNGVVEKFEARTTAMTEGLEKNTDTLDRLSSLFMELAADTNDIRSSLFLPQRNYRLTEETGGEEVKTNLEFFRGVDTILEKDLRDETLEGFSKFINSDNFITLTTELNLDPVEAGSGSIKLQRGDTVYFTITADSPEHIILATGTGEELTFTDYSPELTAALRSGTKELEEHFSRHRDIVARVQSVLNEKEIQTVLDEKELVIRFPEESEDRTYGEIRTRDSRTVLRFSVSKETNDVVIADTQPADMNAWKNMFLRLLESADTRTDEEVLIGRAIERIEELRQDKGFMAYLESQNVSLSKTPREDNDYYYFDLRRPDGERVGSFAVLKMIGEIYLMDADDVPISSLRAGTVSLTDEKKN